MTEHECPCTQQELVSRTKAEMPDQETISQSAGFFKALGDPTRIGILLSLRSQEMCVFGICEVLGISMSAASHQLRLLRESRLVKSRKEGKFVYYSLSDDHVRTMLDNAIEHISEKDRLRYS